MLINKHFLKQRLFPFTFSLFISIILLTACGVIEQDVTVYEEEAWKAQMRIGLTRQELSIVGESTLIETLNQQRQFAQEQGVEYEWTRQEGDDGRIYFVATAAGSGYDLLNSMMFDDAATFESVVYGDRSAIQFSYFPGYDISRYRLTLRVGQVLETDGVQTGKGQVTWEGTGRTMYAVFTPKSRSPLPENWPLIAGIVVGAILLGGVLIVLVRSRKPSRSHQPMLPAPGFCLRCGGQLDPAGRFCPHCGAPRP